jgi:hypothetical protein
MKMAAVGCDVSVGWHLQYVANSFSKSSESHGAGSHFSYFEAEEGSEERDGENLNRGVASQELLNRLRNTEGADDWRECSERLLDISVRWALALPYMSINSFAISLLIC